MLEVLFMLTELVLFKFEPAILVWGWSTFDELLTSAEIFLMALESEVFSVFDSLFLWVKSCGRLGTWEVVSVFKSVLISKVWDKSDTFCAGKGCFY